MSALANGVPVPRSKFLEVLAIAQLSGRGELLREVAPPTDPQDVEALRDLAADLIEFASQHHRKSEALKDAAGEVLGAIRSGTASALARAIVLMDPRAPMPGEVRGDSEDPFRDRMREVRAQLLNESWDMTEEPA